MPSDSLTLGQIKDAFKPEGRGDVIAELSTRNSSLNQLLELELEYINYLKYKKERTALPLEERDEQDRFFELSFGAKGESGYRDSLESLYRHFGLVTGPIGFQTLIRKSINSSTSVVGRDS